MSYEGYSQFLCKHGHYWTRDCNIIDEFAKQLCPFGHPAVWENMVDVTNGSFDDDGKTRIDGYIELEIVHIKECKHCGTITDVTYKVPRKKKHSKKTDCTECLGTGIIDLSTVPCSVCQGTGKVTKK